MAGLESRRRRRAPNRKFKLRKPVWIDPLPAVPGTEPEKRLMEALLERHIYFIFQGEIPELSAGYRLRLQHQLDQVEKRIAALEKRYIQSGNSRELRSIREREKVLRDLATERAKITTLLKRDRGGIFLYDPAFKPDFVIPEYRVILDPFGIFHHSLPDAVKRDAIKSVVYRALGYAFYHPWWDDKGFLLEDNGSFQRVGFDAQAVLSSVAEFKRPPVAKLTDPVDIAAARNPGYLIGKNIGAGANSVALANAKRKRPPKLEFLGSHKRRRVRRRR